MSDDKRLLFRGVEHACHVYDETFSEHIHRCGCDFFADQYAELMDKAEATANEEKNGVWLDGLRPEQVGDRLANAIADAYQALYRVRRLVADAQRHDPWSHQEIAEVAFRAAALDSFAVDPDRFLIDGADVQRELWALLTNLGNIDDYKRVKPLRSVPTDGGGR